MNIEVLSNLFGELADRLEVKSDQHASTSADRVLEYTVANVPVLSGALQSTVRKVKNDDGDYDVLMGDESSDVTYAPYVEWGTSRQAAQPSLTPAAEMERPRLVDNVAQDTF